MVNTFFGIPKMMMPHMSDSQISDFFPYCVIVMAALILVLVLKQCKRTQRFEDIQPVRRSQRVANRRGGRN